MKINQFLSVLELSFLSVISKALHPETPLFKAAEALGAIGLHSNIPLLNSSLDRDPAQEVRETCELALSQIEELPNGSESIESSPFLSVDPAAPSGSSVHQLREVLLNEDKNMYERYSALFGLRNHGGDPFLLSSKL